MLHYRAYPIAPDGKVLLPTHIHAISDEQAIEKVKKFVEAYPIEIWEGARCVGSVAPISKSQSAK
jgi:hypothetical protein